MKSLTVFDRLSLFLVTAFALGMEPAYAHHAMGGGTPTTFGQGFLSGLAHPVIGVDHLAFVIGAGLLALACGQRFRLPLVFIAATAAGAMMAVGGVALPFAELGVVASVAIAGGLLVSGRKLAAPLFVALFAVAGIFHGLAYGSAIVGAESTPLAAYLAGFSLVQFGIAVGAAWLLETARRQAAAPALAWERIAGGVILGVAVAVSAEHLETFLLAAA